MVKEIKPDKIYKPNGRPEWWVKHMEMLAYSLMLNPGDKDIANALKALAYAGTAMNGINKSIKDRAELDELKEKIKQITSARNFDKVR